MPIRLSSRGKWLVRYGAALAVAGGGMLARLALEAWVGPGLPTYVTFYPAVMLAALLGGLGPGLVTTAACALTTDYWILSPRGAFGIEHLADAVGLAIFSGMGVAMSVVAELYRQARFQRLAFLPEDQAKDPRGRALFIDAALVVSLVIVAFAGWRCLRELEATAEADRWTTHTRAVLRQSEQLLSALKDAETGERGYLLTGDERHLAPYHAALVSVETNRAALELLTRDNPIQQQRLAALATPVQERLDRLRQGIELRRTQDLDAALRMMASGKGMRLMDDIRQRVAEIQAEEERLLQARSDVKATRTQNTLRAFLAGNVFGLLVLAAVFLFLRQENIGRRRAEAELRTHRDDLQQIVSARTAELGRANESLRQQREWLHVTLTSIGDAVLAADTAGRITFLNPVAEALTGWKEKDGLGLPIQDVFRVINEETRAPGEDIVARVLREGGVVNLANHTLLVARDGREVPIEDSAAPIKDSSGTVSGVVLVFHDVTEKRRAQSAIRKSQRQNEFLATIIGRSSQPFAVGYPDGRVGLLNPAFEELTGFSALELHAASWINTLTPPEWREVERQKLDELTRTGQPVRYEKEYVRKDGRRVPIELLVHLARDAKGEPEYYYSFLTDISERKQAEEALRKLNEELEHRVAEQTAQIRQANDELEQRVRERTAELEAARDAVQASRGSTLSLLEDALEARAATEQANVKLQAAVESLEASRVAAFNLMEDALRSRAQAEAASAELRENQERLLKLNRVLNALKDSSLAMIRSTSEAKYLADVCRIVVEDCGHAMVWIGFAENDEEKSVRPAAWSGFEAGYLETLHITWSDTDRGRGPTGTAIRTGQHSICRDVLTDPALAPWRAEALKRGYASSVVVPLLAGSRAFGALTIYGTKPDAFSEDEVKLLTQLADDVSFCLRTLRLQVAKAQADLERDKFISLADNSTVFVAMCGRDFVPFYVNEAGLRLVGLDSLARACRTPFSEFFFPEDRKRMLEDFLPAALQMGRAEVEVRFRHFKTGRPLWMLYNVFHIKDAGGKPIGLGIVSRNITDRKQAERRTELLAETASQLLGSDSPQLVVEDLCHRVLAFLDCQVFFNFLVDERAKRLHLNACGGITAEEARRKEWVDFGDGLSGCAAREARRLVAEDIQQTADPRTKLVRSFGVQAYAAFPLIVQDRVLGTLSFGTRTRTHFTRAEISLMKAVADQVSIALERQRAQAALRQSAEELKRSNLDLEQFAYVASHDLQEPLRAVGGYVRLLERDLPKPIDAKAQRFLAGAMEGAMRMERLIHDLLDYSRVGSRARELAPTDLNAVLLQALDNLQPRIASAEATVTHEPLPKLAVDSTQIMQVFQNLIGNALKFRGEPPPEIHVGVCQQNGSWVISVRDNGIGINPEYFGKIFHLFQRLHTRKQYPGTGMGLAVCKRIIERHGGAIWVESQPGKGATFYFSIPAAKG